MDDAEMSNTALTELSMLAPEICKFRAAVTKLRQATAPAASSFRIRIARMRKNEEAKAKEQAAGPKDCKNDKDVALGEFAEAGTRI